MKKVVGAGAVQLVPQLLLWMTVRKLAGTVVGAVDVAAGVLLTAVAAAVVVGVVVADVDADGEVVGELAVVAGADCGSWPKLVLRPQPYSRQLVTWLEEHRAGTEDNPGGCGPRWSNCSWSGGGQPAWLAPGLQVVAVAAG